MESGPEAVSGAAEVTADGGCVQARVDAGEENDGSLGNEIRETLLSEARSWAFEGFQGVGNVPFLFRSQPFLALGMNPGTPVSTTALNLTCILIPSLISRTASSGRVETSKFSLIRLGVFEVVRRAVPRWMAQASKT